MSKTFSKIKDLVKEKKVVISEHGYDEMSIDNILVKDIIDGVTKEKSSRITQIIQKDPVYWYYKILLKEKICTLDIIQNISMKVIM